MLVVVIGLNLLVPVISFSMVGADALKKMIGAPSETDKFMATKGKHTTFKQARGKYEFWLVLFTFSIIVGVAKMVDENAKLIALKNTTTAANNQRAFQVFEVLGSFATGVFLSLFRVYVSPYLLLALFSLVFLTANILMFFISVSTLALYLAVCLIAFVEGGCFVLAGIIAHEDYGSKKYSRILGIFLTGGALGIFIFQKLVFDYLYRFLTASEDNFRAYGKWNKYIFIVCVLSSAMAFIMAVGAFLRTKKQDKGKATNIAEFVNF